MMLAVGVVNAARLNAIFGTPGGNATFTEATNTYAWTGSTNNLMDCFTFSNGELADFTTLKFTLGSLESGASVRINVLYSDNKNSSKVYYSGDETKSTAISELLDASHSAGDVTAIRFGGNSNSGSVALTNVYLENDKFARYASFQTPASSATYTAPTYSTSSGNNNLMTCFEFSNGELASYDKLIVSFKLVSGSVRVGYYVGDAFTLIQSYSTAGVKYLYIDPSTLNSSDPSKITKIGFGGTGSGGSATIVESGLLLTRDRVQTDAKFGTPAFSASYSAPTYTWTASSNNLMDVYTFANGELANFETLDITASNMSSGDSWRVGYVNGSYTNFSGSPYYSAGAKNVDLAAIENDLSTVTKIQMGGNSNSGSINIQESGFVLKTRKFTVDQKSTVCLPFALTADEVTAAGTFYELKSAKDGNLVFSPVTETEANKPYVFVPAKEYPFEGLNKAAESAATTSYTVDGYTFVGTVKKQNVPNGAYGYNATTGAFSKATSDAVTIKARRAYITGPDGAPAKLNAVFGDGETTGIESIDNGQWTIDNSGAMYNLAGQKVGKNYKGIVIQNGKKMIVK